MKILYTGKKNIDIITGGHRRIVAIIEYLSKANEEVIYFQTKGTPKYFGRNCFLLTNLWYILQFLKTDKSEDAIVLEDYSERLNLFIFNFFILFFRRVKLVCLANAFYFSYRKSHIKNFVDKMVSILFFVPMNIVITSGRSAIKEITEMKVSTSKIHVVYPVLRTEFIKYKKIVPIVKHRHVVNLLFVGRVHPIKGLEYLLEAVNILKQENLRLIIVGDNSIDWYTRQIMDKIKSLEIKCQVEFTGKIRNVHNLIERYKKADIFVLPSLWDTSPISLIEAMCFSLPVIASNIGGCSELIDDGVNGLLVSPKNSCALAKAIYDLVNDPKKRLKLGKKGCEKISRFYERTWNDVGREYHDIFIDLNRFKYKERKLENTISS